jgi:hypothetical protein
MDKMQKQHSLSLHLGTTEGNNAVTLTDQEASKHRWVMGTSGSGKSVFIAWLILQLLRFGVTVLALDPHGDVCRLVLSLLDANGFFQSGGEQAFSRLWFVDFGRKNATLPLNVLRLDHTTSYHAASNFLDAIARAFPSSSGSTPLLDNLIQYTAFVLSETGQPATAFQRFLLDMAYRETLLAKISDPQIVQFFHFTLSEKSNTSLISSTMRRLDLLTFSPTLRNALGAIENRLDFRKLYDTGTSCLISLEGCSESEKRLLGCVCMTQIEQSLLSRLELPQEKRTPVHIFCDEAPLFVSQSETAFTNILEQARKAGAVLTFVHQGLHQLPKSMAGALQNCLPIIMAAGSLDSSELASRFFRAVEETSPDFFDLFSFAPRSLPSAFQGIKTVQAARLVFESLRRQEALCMLPEGAVKITTPTIPVKIDQKRLATIEDAYAKKLLVPLRGDDRQITSGAVPSPRLHLVKPEHTLQRRTLQPAEKRYKQLTLLSGSLEQDILSALRLLPYLTLDQITLFLRKKAGNKNYLRTKLNSMIEEHAVAVTAFPRATGGKPLQVYYPPAAGERKNQFLQHSLDCNKVLIAGVLLPIVEQSLTLIDIKSERTLKTMLSSSPCIPDGLITYQTKEGELVHLAFEIDRATENEKRIEQKLTTSSIWVEQLGLDTVTIAFLVTTGDKKRVTWLMDIANEVNTDLADVILFAAASADSITPALCTSPIFTSLDGSSHALIEQPF